MRRTIRQLAKTVGFSAGHIKMKMKKGGLKHCGKKGKALLYEAAPVYEMFGIKEEPKPAPVSVDSSVQKLNLNGQNFLLVRVD